MTPLLLALALASTGAAAVPAAGAATPPDLDLEIRHTVTAVGADGVVRTTDFREQVYRRAGLVWVARVLPPGADEAARQEAAAHAGAGTDHHHAEVGGAARWITLEPGGLRLRLVMAGERLVIEVPPGERASVGFDSDWEATSRFIPARALAAMSRLSERAPAGATWYQGRTAAGTTRVLWDERGQYPRRVESRSAGGAVVKSSVATPIAAPVPAPWTLVGGFALKDYSDLLD